MITIDGKQIKLQIWDTVRLKLSDFFVHLCVENYLTFLFCCFDLCVVIEVGQPLVNDVSVTMADI